MCKCRFIFQGYFISSVLWGIYYGPNDVHRIDQFQDSDFFEAPWEAAGHPFALFLATAFAAHFVVRWRVEWGERWPIWNLSGNCERKNQSLYIMLAFPFLLLSLRFPSIPQAYWLFSEEFLLCGYNCVLSPLLLFSEILLSQFSLNQCQQVVITWFFVILLLSTSGRNSNWPGPNYFNLIA